MRIGTREFARGLASSVAGRDDGLESATDSWVHLGDERGLIAGFRLTDPLRTEAANCVQQLANLGLASAIVSAGQLYVKWGSYDARWRTPVGR